MPYINLIFIIALTLTGIALLSFFGSGGIGVIFNFILRTTLIGFTASLFLRFI